MWRTPWSCDPVTATKRLVYRPIDALHVILALIGRAVKEKMRQIDGYIHVYGYVVVTDNPPKTKYKYSCMSGHLL